VQSWSLSIFKTGLCTPHFVFQPDLEDEDYKDYGLFNKDFQNITKHSRYKTRLALPQVNREIINYANRNCAALATDAHIIT